MLSIIKSISLHGLNGYLVNVEVDVSRGASADGRLYGLPDTSVKESKERIKAAIKNTGIKLESRKIVVNLSPADTKKEGSIYDLPMAIGILMSNKYIQVKDLENTIFVRRIIIRWKNK